MAGDVLRRMLVASGLVLAVFGSLAAHAGQPEITSDVDAATLPQPKTTPLGLYISPKGAHQALTENPDILFIDVRDPVEVTFVGHAEGTDKIIPVALVSREVNPKTGQYRMVGNDDFVDSVNELVAAKGKDKSSPIIVSCRSGARSALAVRKLAEAGYTNVWNLVEGFEGDKGSGGIREKNGWRNAGLPWAYKLEPGVAWQP